MPGIISNKDPSMLRIGAATLIVVTLCATSFAAADPTEPQPWWPIQPTPLPLVHPLFSSDMVLQRDIAAPIWGWSKPGAKVAVSIDGKPAAPEAIASSDGKWQARLSPLPAGGPHTIEINSGIEKVALSNVLVGDVWLCVGQSNMNWPVRLSQNAEEEIKQANHPQIRSFNVGFYPSLVPTKLPQPARWEVCTPEFARNFTGVGYFFARELQQKLQVPIGIIHSSVGATFAEAWTSGEALRRLMPYDFRSELAEVEQLAGPDGETFDYFAELEKWAAQIDPASARDKYASNVDLNTDDWRDIEVPKPWEEAGLADFDGLVWFRHWIEVPQEWAGGELQLQLSIINDCDLTWLNGTLIGAKQIKGIRTYNIRPELVKAGKNLLTVAILNKSGPGGFCSAPPNMGLRPLTLKIDKPLRIAGTWKAKKSLAMQDIATPLPVPKVRDYRTTTAMYNGMIAPLLPFAIKGALWYQGEANGPRWLQYRRLLPTLIADWRQRFRGGRFSVLDRLTRQSQRSTDQTDRARLG